VKRGRTPALKPRLYGVVAAVLLALGAAPPAAPRQAPSTPVFRASRDLVSIDVVVRDGSGALVRGLSKGDFEVSEDGRGQEVLTLGFEEVTGAAAPTGETADLLAAAAEAVTVSGRVQATPRAASTAAAIAATNPFAGRRLVLLLFDVSSMQGEDVVRALEASRAWVDRRSPSDLVAVATIGSSLTVLTDFTDSRERLEAALATISASDAMAAGDLSAATMSSDEAGTSTEGGSDASDLDLFNNDLRLRALKAVSDALAPVEQKKAIVYFSSGIERSGDDNQVELRAAINASVKANVSIYPVDARGLQAMPPGGDASQASGGGVGMFTGGDATRRADAAAASQDTLYELADETGGRAFADTNDLGEVFARVERDVTGYYLLGYSSSNTGKDGRFRRVRVRVRGRRDLKVESRPGYYAERDFTHTNRSDREAQLREQLTTAVSSTDLPVLASGAYFRLAKDRYFVPLSVAIPGSAVPVAPGAREAVFDVIGVVRDEQDRPVGALRDTVKVPASGGPTLAGRQVLYQSGLELPPGRFALKVVARENASGLTGSFEAPLVVPDLAKRPLKVSAIVLSSQLETSTVRRSDNPLLQDGLLVVPNLTHVVSRSQRLYFFYEVYDPSAAPDGGMHVRTSLAFYRGKRKVFETPVVERTAADVASRKAVVFRFDVPATGFPPGVYTCQVNVIDTVGGAFTFPRIVFQVK
jgi:VWFA-related protein